MLESRSRSSRKSSLGSMVQSQLKNLFVAVSHTFCALRSDASNFFIRPHCSTKVNLSVTIQLANRILQSSHLQHSRVRFRPSYFLDRSPAYIGAIKVFHGSRYTFSALHDTLRLSSHRMVMNQIHFIYSGIPLQC